MPRNSAAYFEAMRKAVGATVSDASHRLYLVPGMNHCGGGDGASHFDMLGALEQWHEHGTNTARSQAASPPRTKPAALSTVHALCAHIRG